MRNVFFFQIQLYLIRLQMIQNRKKSLLAAIDIRVIDELWLIELNQTKNPRYISMNFVSILSLGVP
jgi:hypothetical protein